MKLTEASLPGVWVVEPDFQHDERGWFARVFDEREFSERGMSPHVVQCSLSFSTRRDTLRGMHYQEEPHGEAKLVRCVQGAVFDVALDLRADSPTHRQWFGVELSAADRRALYFPPGVAHGFQTLVDGSELLYQIGQEYVPEAGRGVRFDDPAFGIRWPAPAAELIVSERDRSYPDYRG